MTVPEVEAVGRRSQAGAAPILEVRNLAVEFRTGKGVVRAVDGIDLVLDRGETLSLVGESGCGKTTAALSILNLLPHRSALVVGGQILLDGVDLLRLEPAQLEEVRGQRIAMIFQDPMTSLNPLLTVGRQLREGLQRHLGLGRRAADEAAIENLAKVGIPNPRRRARDYPHEFSGGMRQRVMVAMALGCEPDVLVADEPTTALDVTVQAQIMHLIAALQEDLGMAMLLITHDLGVVAEMADRVAVMYAGRIVESGPTDKVLTAPAHPYTKGMLSSVPLLTEGRESRLEPVPGTPPDLARLPSGCRFRPRCPRAAETCHRDPLLSELTPGADRQVACWFPMS